VSLLVLSTKVLSHLHDVIEVAELKVGLDYLGYFLYIR